jgi:hypothetical protein
MRLEKAARENDEASKKRRKSANRTLKTRLDDYKRQRDKLLSICHSQQTLIEELRDEIRLLEEGKKPLSFPGGRGRDS